MVDSGLYFSVYKAVAENYLQWAYVGRGKNFEQYLTSFEGICISITKERFPADGRCAYELKVSSPSGEMRYRNRSNDQSVKDLHAYLHDWRESEKVKKFVNIL